MSKLQDEAISTLVEAGFSQSESTLLFNRTVVGYKKHGLLGEEVKEVVKPIIDGVWLNLHRLES